MLIINAVGFYWDSDNLFSERGFDQNVSSFALLPNLWSSEELPLFTVDIWVRMSWVLDRYNSQSNSFAFRCSPENPIPSASVTNVTEIFVL